MFLTARSRLVLGAAFPPAEAESELRFLAAALIGKLAEVRITGIAQDRSTAASRLSIVACPFANSGAPPWNRCSLISEDVAEFLSQLFGYCQGADEAPGLRVRARLHRVKG